MPLSSLLLKVRAKIPLGAGKAEIIPAPPDLISLLALQGYCSSPAVAARHKILLPLQKKKENNNKKYRYIFPPNTPSKHQAPTPFPLCKNKQLKALCSPPAPQTSFPGAEEPCDELQQQRGIGIFIFFFLWLLVKYPPDTGFATRARARKDGACGRGAAWKPLLLLAVPG